MFENVTSGFFKGANSLFYGSLIFIFLAGLAVVVILILLLRKYNKHVLIKKKISGGYMLIFDKCKIFTDDEGNKWWQRLKEKDKVLKYMEVPPSNAVIPDRKGEEYAVCKMIDGHYIWLEDKDNVASIPTTLFKDMPTEIINESDTNKKIIKERAWKNSMLELWKKENNIEFAFHPVTSNQRAIIINALKRAYDRMAKSWQTQLPMIVGIGALVIIVVALLIFYGNIAKPAMEMADKAVKFQEVQNEGLVTLKEIKNDIQTIKGSTTQNKNTNVPGG